MKANLFKSQAGFGFFGMMVLVIILALASSLVMVSMDTNVSNQALAETIKKMDRIETAAKKFKTDNGSYPTTLDRLFTIGGLAACAPSTLSSKMINWCGPYLSAVTINDPTDYTVDGWGTSFEYDGVNTLNSWGPNKTDNNGAGDDITRTFP